MNLRADQDDWGRWPITLDEDKLAVVRAVLQESPVIVEHRHYRGSRAPDRRVFEEFEALAEYLQSDARPGDSIWCWRYSEVCRDDNAATWGKLPNERGEVPKGGAY